VRINLVPVGTLVFVLFISNKANAQRLIPPNITNAIQHQSLVSDRLKLPDVKSPFITIGSARFLSRTSNASADAQQPLFQSTGISSDMSLWNIPFSFRYNSINGWQNTEPLNFGVTQFDKEKYLQQLAERLKKTVSPEELFASHLNKLYASRNEIIHRVRKDLASVLPAENEEWMKEIMDKVNADNIAYLGMDGLINKLTAKAGSEIAQKETALLQLKTAAQQQSPDAIVKVENELSSLHESKKRIEGQLTSLRKKWLDAGIMEAMGSFEKQKRILLDKLMKDPAAIAKAASQHLNLHGLRKLMLHATSANLGSSGVTQGDLQLKNILLNGVNAGFLKGNRYLAPVLGKQPGLKNIAEAGFANFNQLPDIFTAALRIGKGDIQQDFSHVSFALFQQSNNAQLLQNGLDLTRALPQNFVTTFSKRMSFGENNYLLTEISKSTMLYNRGSQQKGDGFRNMVNSDNLLGNMGVTLDYGSEFESIGLVNKLTLRYTGKEYQNLGNAFLAGGTKEISNDLKKHFLARRLVVHSRINYREYAFSVNDRKWRSFSYLVDAKWKMKKGEFIEVRYQPYFNRSISQESSMQSRSHRVALRGNISRKISRRISYRNFIELASSNDDSYNMIFGGSNNTNKLISFTSIQTITLGSRTLFVNVMGNRAKQNTGFLFGNSSFSVDAGTQFMAGNRFMLSSAIVYNQVSELYEQLAIRQSVSAMLGKKLVVEGYLQTGANLYESPGFDMPSTTGNLSISYNLK
jgi:hypothetical protein